MRKLITFIYVFLSISGCNSNKPNNVMTSHLPYFHTADFTPLWLTETTQIDTLHTIAHFEFLNQNNQKVTPETFKGKIHVMNCFFTICPSLCPRLMSGMKEVQKAFKDDKSVLFASYSVTPERDSVAVLKEYAQGHQIPDNQWYLLTGNKKQIYETARKSYFADENIGVQKGENDFLHTENFILVDKNLHIRGIYNGTLPLEIEQLVKDIEQLKKEG
ncbi:MAG: SCO family protein [Spirosomataceae bacterium]